MRKMNFHIQVALWLLAGLMLAACNKQEFGLPATSQNFAASITYNNKVDIVLMMDNSSSMIQYQNKFSSQVSAMVNNLNSTGLDYHIAVVTTDMRTGGNGGKFIGSPAYVSNSTPNLVSTLQSHIAVGQLGSDLERGLDSVRAALQPAYLAGAGRGFLRDDALLAIVILTNEDDYSSDSTSSYEDFFDMLKPNFNNSTKGWILNFVGVVSLTAACSTTADYKEPGLRYMELADYTGGVKASVCDSSLAAAISNVHVRIVEILSEYPLKSVPNISTISVSLNGVSVPHDATNGWTYDSVANTIHFHGSYQPGVSDNVQVHYTPATGT